MPAKVPAASGWIYRRCRGFAVPFVTQIMEIGNQIKNLRTQRGLTQETVAAALGVTSQAVSKWENR